VNLKEWARLQGIHPQMAYRWFRKGTLPVPAVRVNSRSVLVAPDAVTAPAQGGTGLYARVSSHDQRADLDPQVARLTAWAVQSGRAVVRYAARDTGPTRPKAAP
jgi:putative resolvase